MFTVSIGPARRELSACRSWAMSSFPVPVSPRIRTGTSALAKDSARRKISRKAGACVMKDENRGSSVRSFGRFWK